MSKPKQEMERIVRELESGTMSRREFVARASALGLGLGTIGLVLTACNKPRKQGSADAGASTVTDKDRDRQPAQAPLEKELNVYNWSDYIAEDTVASFEKEFGVNVIYDTYENNEEVIAKLQAGASGYDIVVPSNYVVPVMVATGLVSKLDKTLLPNLTNLAATFVNPAFDPGNEHAVPYQWGTTGIAYRTDKIKDTIDSWEIFLDKKYSGKMTQMDDMRDVIGAWLKYRGHSLSSVEPAELAQAKTDALAAKKNLKAYISAPVKSQLITGDVWIAQLWNGDTAQARVEQPALAYVLPREGCTIWTDSMMITRNAPHPRAAHAFINYILRPEVGAAISNTTGYGSPNQAAQEKMTTPIPYPTAEELARLEYQTDLGEGGKLWDQIWTEIKAS